MLGATNEKTRPLCTSPEAGSGTARVLPAIFATNRGLSSLLEVSGPSEEVLLLIFQLTLRSYKLTFRF